MVLSCYHLQQAARASSYPRRGIPGPNAYNLQSSFTDKRDFSVGVSRVFRLPVAVQPDGPKHRTPAPNQYDVCAGITRDAFKDSALCSALLTCSCLSLQVSCGSRQSSSSAVGTSAFLSKTRRDSFYPNKNVPSPCNYLYLSKFSVFILMMISSTFVSHFYSVYLGFNLTSCLLKVTMK